MDNRKAIGYVTANYASKHQSALLDERPLASLPFAGRYRLVDFAISNMVNAGITTVGLVMPGNYRSLIDHLSSTKDWGLDRKRGGMYFLPGSAYGTSKHGMRFLLRDIIASKSLFQRSKAPYVVMCGTNMVFNIDLAHVIDSHEESGADITMVYVRAERSHDEGVAALNIGERGRVASVTRGVNYGDAMFMDCCVIGRDLLLDVIDHYGASDYLDIFEALGSEFGRLDVCSYEFKGAVLGIFGENTYYQRSMELLNPTLSDQLFCPERPILTKAHDAPPAKYASGANACNSMISSDCIVEGTVRGSILSRKVVVERGASVTNSIIMQSCVIRSGARVENAIIDKNNEVPAHTELRGTPDAILVVGKGPVKTVSIQ